MAKPLSSTNLRMLRFFGFLFFCVVLFSPDKHEQYPKTTTKNHMAKKHRFVCAINCMDGRIQDAVKDYLQKKYGADFVDMITEPGPDKILAENTNIFLVRNIAKRVGISINHHGAKIIAIVGHDDCAGNPVEKDKHIGCLRTAKKVVEDLKFDAKVILLWVETERKEVVEIK